MVLKELILTVSTLGRYGSLERTDFNSFYFGKVWCSLERTDFNSFYFGECVVVLKELILTVSTLGRCGSLERN